MQSFDKFKLKMNLSGGSIRNENIKNSKHLFAETFADDASFTLGIYFWEFGDCDYCNKDQLKIRIFKRTYSAAQGITAKFQTPVDMPVIVGDVIYDINKDDYWICTEAFDLDGIHWHGKLTLCNWILKWQNKNGDILEYPCYDQNTTQYNSGEQSNSQFTIGSSQHMLTLPYDKNTIVLKSPQRFFLDKDLDNPTSFIVTQNDNTSHNYGDKGIVRITVMECANNNETDRFDLGICDYVEIDDIRTDNADDTSATKVVALDSAVSMKSIISYDKKVITSGGDMRTFVGKFFDDKGVEIMNIEPNWTIVCDFKDALQIEHDDNYIKIGVDDDQYIDEEFKLILADDKGNHSSSVIIRIESLL